MFRRFCFRSLIIIAAGATAWRAPPAAATRRRPDPGGGGRGRGRGGDGAAAPVVTAKVTSKRRAGRSGRDRQRRSVRQHLAALAGHRRPRTTVVPRRRSRQAGTAALHARSPSVRGGARAGRGEPGARPALLAQAEAQLARDASNAEYMQLTAERQQQLNQRGIISKDVAEQTRSQADATAAVVKADRASIDSARAQLVAQQAAVDDRARVARLHHDQVADRRPDRQPRREGRQPGHREPDRADDDRAGAAGARHLHRAGDSPRHDQVAHGRRQAAGHRDAAGHRGAARRSARSPSSTTPST